MKASAARKPPAVVYALLAQVAVVTALAVSAAADEVTVDGTALHGRVVGLSSDTIRLRTEYGTGVLSIEYGRIETLRTDGRFQILHGEDGVALGRLFGVVDGDLLVGEDEASTVRVPVTTIHLGLPFADGRLSTRDRLRSTWRYWGGSVDLGFSLAQTTVDTSAFSLGVHANREKGPLGLVFGADYLYGTEKRRGESRSTLQDNLRGRARSDYELTERLYHYASGDAEYDAIERLSIRGVPQTGLGYYLYKTAAAAFSVECGGAWIYERYFGGDEDDYFAVALGAMARAALPYGARFRWRMDYLPAVDEWTRNYLIRTSAALTMPLIEPVNLKLSVLDEYNNRPAEDTGRNKLVVTVGLSLAF